jgi:hypothetical protein
MMVARSLFGTLGTVGPDLGDNPAYTTHEDNNPLNRVQLFQVFHEHDGSSRILDQCDALGITLWVESGRLLFSAPKGALTSELRALVSDHKAELITRLSAKEPATAPLPFSGIAIPADWRWTVANLPTDQWLAWHRLSGEMTPPGRNIRSDPRSAPPSL